MRRRRAGTQLSPVNKIGGDDARRIDKVAKYDKYVYIRRAKERTSFRSRSTMQSLPVGVSPRKGPEICNIFQRRRTPATRVAPGMKKRDFGRGLTAGGAARPGIFTPPVMTAEHRGSRDLAAVTFSISPLIDHPFHLRGGLAFLVSVGRHIISLQNPLSLLRKKERILA